MPGGYSYFCMAGFPQKVPVKVSLPNLATSVAPRPSQADPTKSPHLAALGRAQGCWFGW